MPAVSSCAPSALRTSVPFTRNRTLSLPTSIASVLLILPELSAFFLERLRFLLEKKGHASDTIESVLTTDCSDVADAAERVEAVEALRGEQDFAPLATAFKRMQNILAQGADSEGEPDLSRMTDDAEKALALDYLQARGMLGNLIADRRWRDALGIMASLGPSLDRFFTEVLVMAEDPEVKANRIALLRSIRDQFVRVARFSEIRG